MTGAPVARPRWQRFYPHERLRPHFNLLPLVGLIPAFLLATWSLTQPWARARVVMLWGISRSPEALMLVVITLAGMVAASVAVAARSRLRVAGFVHLAIGLGMCVVAGLAFRFISHSGLKFLFIPIASVKPGKGLWMFVIAAGFVFLLGLVELALAAVRAARATRAAGNEIP